jgi:hypothetical protein
MRRASTTTEAATSPASCLEVIGVVPAWEASPWTVSRCQELVRRSVEANPHQLFLDGLAVGVGELVGVVEGDSAGGDRRPEHVGAETDAFLLSEEPHLDVTQRLDAGVVEGAHHLDPAQHPQGAVEGAAVATVSMWEPMSTHGSERAFLAGSR